MPITHAFVSGYVDSTDKSLVKPSDWNAAHVGTTIDLQVNGTPNQSQTLLNLAQANGVVIQDQGNGNVQLSVGTITENQVANLPLDLASKAPLASPALTGTPTAPTASTGDNSSAIATTAFVTSQISYQAPVSSVAGKTGAVTLFETDITGLPADLAAKAPLASPALTGTPTAPTAATNNNSTEIATTAFVQAAIGAGLPTTPEPTNTVLAGPASGASAPPTFRALVVADIPSLPESQIINLTSDLAAKAPLASPALTGAPTAPTPATGNNSTAIATTAFVDAQIAASGPGLAPVQSVAGKTGVVTLVEADVANLTTDLASKAPLASPTLTGTPTAPTPTAGDNSTTIATTAFVDAAIAAGGGGGGLPTAPEPANVVLAGPSSGANAAPTFRALVANDIPNILNSILMEANAGYGLWVTVPDNDNALIIEDPSGAARWNIYKSGADLWFQNALPSNITPVQFVGATGAVNLQYALNVAGIASLNGGATTTTPAPGDSSTKVATTAFIQNALSGGGGSPEPAHTVLAGPTSGANAAPTFRALVSTDMPTTGAGSGTVTSVGLNAPSEFTIIGTPVTSVGTIALSKANQSGNTVWASPPDGSSGQPVFRALVAADIPGTLNTTTFAGTGASGTQPNVTMDMPAAGTGAALQVNGPGSGTQAAVYISNGTNGGYSLQIGSPGNAQPTAIMIANASTVSGSAKLTIIGTSGGLVGNIPGNLFAIGEQGATWRVSVDTSGNMGVEGTLRALAFGGDSQTQTANDSILWGDSPGNNFFMDRVNAGQLIFGYNTPKGTGQNAWAWYDNSTDRVQLFSISGKGTSSGSDLVTSQVNFSVNGAIQVNPTTNATGVQITSSSNPQLNVTDGTNSVQIAISGGPGTYFTDAAQGDAIIRAPGSAGKLIRLGTGGGASTLQLGNGQIWAGGSAGVTAGAFSSITSIQSKWGIIIALAGSSDERLKTIERPYEGGLDAVLKLTPVYYRWNEEGAKYTGLPGDRIYLGFTAQDAQQAIAECVTGTEGDGEWLSFDEKPIVAALVDAVKELAARVKKLEAKRNEKRN